MEIRSKTEATAQGLPRYFTGKPCARGHVSERFTASRRCVECSKEQDRKRYPARAGGQRTAARLRAKAYRQEHPEKARDESNRRVTAWRKENPDRDLENVREWRKANRHKTAAWSAERRAAKLSRTPSWLNQEQRKEIAEFYKRARRLSKATGVPHEVDHIIPLNGGTVSGLHVPWNLQILTAEQNRLKNNSFIGEKPWQLLAAA